MHASLCFVIEWTPPPVIHLNQGGDITDLVSTDPVSHAATNMNLCVVWSCDI